MHIILNKNRGVVLLYAVLLVSIVLTISLSLMNITYKQIILTAVSKDSQVAHFIALSALDCVRSANKFFNDGEPDFEDSMSNPFGVFHFFSPPLLQQTTFSPNTPGETVYTCGNGSDTIKVKIDTPSGIVTSVGDSAQGVESSYKITGLGLLVGLCADVTVAKIESGNYSDDYGPESSRGDDSRKTFYKAKGYNTCDSSSSRLVERHARVRL